MGIGNKRSAGKGGGDLQLWDLRVSLESALPRPFERPIVRGSYCIFIGVQKQKNTKLYNWLRFKEKFTNETPLSRKDGENDDATGHLLIRSENLM